MTARDVTGFCVFPRPSFWHDFLTKLRTKPEEKRKTKKKQKLWRKIKKIQWRQHLKIADFLSLVVVERILTLCDLFWLECKSPEPCRSISQ